MFCPYCGAESDGGQRCGKCGALLGEQGFPNRQPSAPKRKGKRSLLIAIVAIAVVAAFILAAVLVATPKTEASTAKATMSAYFEGTKEHNATKMIDCSIMHFDTANRSSLLDNWNGWNFLWLNASATNTSVTDLEEISTPSVPSGIMMDVMNFTDAVQDAYRITIQGSQFVKVTMKQTNSSVDFCSRTTYTLFSMVGGVWYYDIYVSYTTAEWSANCSMGDMGWDNFFNGSPATPTGHFYYPSGRNISGYWTPRLESISSPTVKYTDCEVQLIIGDQQSSVVAIPASTYVTIPINGSAQQYELIYIDSDVSGYLSPGDAFLIGPRDDSGSDPSILAGSMYTLRLLYAPTGGLIAETNFWAKPYADSSDLMGLIRSSGQLIVGTQVPYAPFEYLNLTSGKYEGIDMEIAQRVAMALNVTLVIKTMDFDPLFAAVQTGQIDMAISAITIAANREKTVNFTAPYYSNDQVVLVRDNSTITNIDGLNGTAVITQLGTTGSYWAQTNLVDPGRDVSLTDIVDLNQAVTAVQNGQKAAFIVDSPVAYSYANTASNHLKVAFVIHTNERYGICIPQNQVGLRNALDKVIDDMKADGSLQTLLLKYNAI